LQSNTLEALAGTYIVRFANGRDAMNQTPDIFKFAILSVMASATIAATAGATGLLWGGLATLKNTRRYG
jgi:integral membrane sensor domain MASE1